MEATKRAVARRSGPLMPLGKALRYLAETTDLLSVVDIRDQAEAVRQFCKTASQGLDAQNNAAQIKLRAERRAGELLRDMRDTGYRRGAGRPQKNGHDDRISLSDIGVDENESKRFQQAAALPEKDFERYIKEATESRQELTSIEVRRRAKAYVKTKKQAKRSAERQEHAKGTIITDLSVLDGQTFGTIYADPPWQYGNQSTRAATKNHYQTLTVEQLCGLPIADLAEKDAHLHLWTTNGFLPDSFRVIEAWGFEYRSCLVWCKPQLGIGNYWRISHEFLLLGVRGDATRFYDSDRDHRSWVELPRTKHSTKPHEFRALVEQVSPGPYLELFGRRAVDNWTVFGNEVEQRLFG